MQAVSRNWCWTIFLERKVGEESKLMSQDDLNKITTTIANNPGRYTVFAHEKTKDGKQHLQGYSEFEKPLRIAALKKLWDCNWLHAEKRRGTREQAREYCRGWEAPIVMIKQKGEWIVDQVKTKRKHDVSGFSELPDANAFEHGGQGTRNDYQCVVEDITEGKPMTEIIESYPEIAIKYPNGISKVQAIMRERLDKEERKKQWKDFKLTKWEVEVLDELKKDNEDRKILWILDPKGGCGKSTFSDYLEDMHDAFTWNAEVSFKNIACALGKLQDKPRIVIFDLTRQKQGMIDYAIMEALTRGRLCSGKYDSTKIYFPKPVRVVCMANWEPDYEAVSKDRWDVRKLTSMTDPSTKQDITPYEFTPISIKMLCATLDNAAGNTKPQL